MNPHSIIQQNIRSALRLLVNAHRQGFGGIRFMPVLGFDRTVLLFSIRKYFYANDGLRMAFDLQHRAFKLELSGDSTDWGDLQLVAKVREALRPVDFGHLADPRRNAPPLGHDPEMGLHLPDPDYTKWLVDLVSMLETFRFAALRCVDAPTEPLWVDFIAPNSDELLAPSIRFRAPPSGVLHGAPSLHASDDPAVRVAQSRDADAPSLLWERGPRQEDQHALGVEHRYDEHGRSERS